MPKESDQVEEPKFQAFGGAGVSLGGGPAKMSEADEA